MGNPRSHEEITSADKTSVGFDYQYYYFLYTLLELKRGQSIGYEVKDDVHIELDSGKYVLMQIKHSVQKKADNSIINLTERDKDLWKTIYNWINVINDENSGRKDSKSRLEFLRNTEFILVSNKAESKSNDFVNNIKKYQANEISLDDIKKYLIDLERETKESDEKKNITKIYVQKLLSQSDDWLALFFKNIKFDLEQDDLVEKIKDKIREKYVDDDKVEDVLHWINSSMNIWKFENVKKGEKLQITFEEVRKRFHKCFQKGRSNKLPIRTVEIVLPDSLNEQIFVRQLLDIEDIEEDDYIQIVEFTTYKMQVVTLLESWLQDGLITEDEKEEFERNCMAYWKNAFREAHRESKRILKSDKYTSQEKEEMIKQNALKCLDKIRSIELQVDETDLGIEKSNGQFYSLSDRLLIGWLLEWEKRYGK